MSISLFVPILIFGPYVFFTLDLLRGSRPMATLYGVLLYSTFLGEVGALPIGFSSAAVMGLGLVTLELGIGIAKPRPWAPPTPLDGLVLGYFAWAMVGLMVHEQGLGHIRGPMTITLLLFASKLRPDFDEASLKRVSRAVAIGGGMLAIVVLIQLATDDPTLGGLVPMGHGSIRIGVGVYRPPGLQADPNEATLYLLMGTAAMLSLAEDARTRPRFLAWVVVSAITVYTAFQTRSRSGVGGISLVLLTFFAGRLTGRRWLGLATGLGGALLVYAIPGISELMLKLIRPDRDELFRAAGRVELWLTGLEVMLEHPIFGNPKAELGYETINYHNIWIQNGARYGILGGLLFIAMLWTAARRAWRRSAGGGGTQYERYVSLAVVGAAFLTTFNLVLLGGICFWMSLGLAANNQRQLEGAGATSTEGERPARPRAPLLQTAGRQRSPVPPNHPAAAPSRRRRR